MALLAGIYRMDGGPVSPSLLETVNARGLLLAPDRATQHAHGNMGLASRQLLRKGASRAASLLSHPKRDHRVVFDGRLDNRDELAARLKSEGHFVAAESDAGITLAAYEAWGLDAAVRLLGDFSWAIWDGEEHRLILARDGLGLRPLFYAHQAGLFAFASQLDQLLSVLRPGEEDLDLTFLADYFIFGKSVPTSTPFKSIRSVPPGHLMIVDRQGARFLRYWDLEDREKLHYPDASSYAEHFLELFRTAVRAQLQADGPVWSDLSGGLDSSSIASLAAVELERGNQEVRASFATISVVHDEARESDERKWSRTVLDRYGLRNHAIPGDALPGFKSMAEGARYWDMPTLGLMSYSLHRHIIGLFQQHDVAAVLKGLGAESVVLGEILPPWHFADLLRQFRWKRLTRELLRYQDHSKVPLWTLFSRFALGPLLKQRSVTPRPAGGVPRWLNSDFVARMDLRDRAHSAWFSRKFRSAADQWQYEQIGRLASSLHPGCFHKACDVRLPFLYRPLVELAMAIPWEAKVRLGTNKILLREAMRGILPEEIRTRTQLVSGTPAVYHAFRQEWPDLVRFLQDGCLARWGLIDKDLLLQDLSVARQGGWKFLPGLLMPIALEAWLRPRLHPD